MKKTKLLVALCLAGSMGFAQFNNVVNIAGTGSAGVGTPQPNNLGTAATAPLAIKNIIGGPTGVVVDHSGNVYYIDNANNCIMKINHASGTVNLVAGNGASPNIYGGYYDDGIAGHAIFSGPNSLCLDASGNLYISDSRNNIVRMVQATGSGALNASCGIITVAGVQGQGCSQNSTGSCGDGGAANAALLTHPLGIVIDQSNNLLIADDNAIRKVTTPYNPGSSVISSIVGNTQSTTWTGVTTIALDPVNGDLYFGNGPHVYKIQAVGGLIPTSPTPTLFAGSFSGTAPLGDNGQAVNASLKTVFGLAVDANHNVYIADNPDNRIRKVSANIITTVAGTGTAGTFNYPAPSGNGPGVNITPYALATDACGSVYFSDYYSQVIGKLANPVTFAPNFPVTAMSVCSGSVLNATVNSGSNVSTIYPDSYTWSLISANSSWAPDGGGNVANGTISNPGSNSITIPISTTGLTCSHNYILQVTATKNCPVLTAATSTAHVTINCTPTPVISGNTTICSGSSTTLCENLSGSPYTINWTIVPSGSSVGATSCITVSPSANTTYKVGITNTASGCYGSATQLVTVVTNNPSFSLMETPTGQYFNFKAVANMVQSPTPSGYQEKYVVQELTGPGGTVKWTSPSPSYWNVYPAYTYFNGFDNYPNDYSSGFTLPASSSTWGEFSGNTTYVVSHTTWNNTCSASTPYSYTFTLPSASGRYGDPVLITKGDLVQDVTGINYLSNNSPLQQITVYPNPSNGNFIIETNSSAKQSLQVFDVNGRVVLTQTISGTATIDAGSLTSGVYNVSITSNEGVINKRLIISK